MDPQIEELKEMVRQNTALAQENNKMLRAMRSSQRWSSVLRVVWWLTILGVSGAFYYYYVAPYIKQLLQIYQNMQSGAAEAGQVSVQITNLLNNFLPGL